MDTRSTSTVWRKLGDTFFAVDAQNLAVNLLGKLLVRRLPDSDALMWGRIVETEAYLGETDEAAHTYKLRQTARNTAMFMKPGTAYVYFTYGMYYCFNISSAGPGAGVLLRALEPLGGLETMQQFRQSRLKRSGVFRPELHQHKLANGPAKLCLAFDIDKRFDQQGLDVSDWLWVAEDSYREEGAVICTSRIGLNAKFGEWATKPLRYYLASSRSVSVRDTKAESCILRPMNSECELNARPVVSIKRTRASRKRKNDEVT